MWEPEAAEQLLRHACGPSRPEGEVRAMVGEWCASRRERQSRVSPDQRAAVYAGLQARIDALPAAWLRRGAPAGGGGGGGGARREEAAEAAAAAGPEDGPGDPV
jgi:hypothetical protein